MKLIFRFWQKKERLTALLIMAGIIVQVLLETQIPMMMSGVAGDLQTGRMDLSGLEAEGWRMLLYALGAFAMTCGVSFLVSRTGSRICGTLRETLFRKIVSLSLADVNAFGTGTLISRCTDDVLSVQSFVTQSLQALISAPVMLVAVLLRISAIESVWVWMAGGAILILAIVVGSLFSFAIPLARRGSIVRDRMVTATREHVLGIREVHAASRFDRQQNAYDEVNRDITKFNIQSKTILSLFSPLSSMLVCGLSLGAYLSGAVLMAGHAEAQQIAVFSNAVAFVSYIALLFSSLINIVLILISLPHLMNVQRRILEVLDRESGIPEGRGAAAQTGEHGTVVFDHVSFRYPGSQQDVLTDLCFEVRPGQTVAVIGGTGAGKTSLLNLIPRLYDATSGEIRVDGVPIRDYRLEDLRNRIGYVPQRNYLFLGSIADNIAYGENGRLRATMEEIRNAAVIGQADEFIRRKEQGYDSEVQSGGGNFSGGQRQRLTISRALCRDPEIYLFDDSFSALDFRTEANLRAALKKTTAGASVIIVGQRISTVRAADLILVLDRGKIVGQGTHEELMRTCEVYAEISRSQSDGEGAA